MKTHEEAFAPGQNDVRIPIKDRQQFEFTRRWFESRNIVTWSTHLAPRFTNDKVWHAIQIGVFEGMDLVWLMQNCLGNQLSTVMAIDPWAATTKLDEEFMEGVFKRAVKNLSQWTHRIEVMRAFSQDLLPELRSLYDLIIIDGDHTAPAVLKDAEQALRLLKSGGWMVFDDVRNRVKKPDHVQDGIDQFLALHRDEVRLEFQHRYVDCYSKL